MNRFGWGPFLGLNARGPLDVLLTVVIKTYISSTTDALFLYLHKLNSAPKFYFTQHPPPHLTSADLFSDLEVKVMDFENQTIFIHIGSLHIRVLQICRVWSGGAKVLSKLSVPGRPTTLDDSRARAYCACSRCGWGLFGHFFSHLSFLFSFSLSLGDGPI